MPKVVQHRQTANHRASFDLLALNERVLQDGDMVVVTDEQGVEQLAVIALDGRAVLLDDSLRRLDGQLVIVGLVVAVSVSTSEDSERLSRALVA